MLLKIKNRIKEYEYEVIVLRKKCKILFVCFFIFVFVLKIVEFVYDMKWWRILMKVMKLMFIIRIIFGEI